MAAVPGYMSMPDGSFKVVPKEGRPVYIAPNMPKKRAGTAAPDARPAFIQVRTAPGHPQLLDIHSSWTPTHFSAMTLVMCTLCLL